jgi:hypothetical protein
MKKVFLLEQINRYNGNSDTIVEVSISEGKAKYDEEYEEYEDFERSDYISERFFKEDGKEIPEETYFDKYSQEYEEADWVEEALFPSLEEAEKHAKLIINEILKN